LASDILTQGINTSTIIGNLVLITNCRQKANLKRCIILAAAYVDIQLSYCETSIQGHLTHIIIRVARVLLG